jgi:mRNA interferase RelE/StbE
VRVPPYTALWPARATADLARIAAGGPRQAERIVNAVDRYAASGQGDVRRLRGEPHYRLRVGDWRVIFALDHAQQQMIVLRVAHRRDVYRD